MTQYNCKITTDGKYLPFHSWGVLMMVKSDMTFIENFIKNNRILNKYYSALPPETYHITIYSIWYNGLPLINHQKKSMLSKYSKDVYDKLEAQSRNIGYFNPDNCLDDLLYKCYVECEEEKTLEDTKLSVQSVYVHNQIGIPFQFTFCNELRHNLIKICDHDDKAGHPHITLAYLYKDIPPDMEKAIQGEINILNLLLKNQTIVLYSPRVYYSSDMVKWYKFQDYIKKISNRLITN